MKEVLFKNEDEEKQERKKVHDLIKIYHNDNETERNMQFNNDE